MGGRVKSAPLGPAGPDPIAYLPESVGCRALGKVQNAVGSSGWEKSDCWGGPWAEGAILGGWVKSAPLGPASPDSLLLLLPLLGCSTRGRGRNSEGPVDLEKGGSLSKEGAVLEILVNSELDLGLKLAPSAPKLSMALQSSDCFDSKTRSLSVGSMLSCSDLIMTIVRTLQYETEGLSDGRKWDRNEFEFFDRLQ